MSFSERQGYKNISKIDPETMPDSVRRRIWNALKKFFDNYSKRNEAIKKVWDEFFKGDIDNLKRTTGGTLGGAHYYLDDIKSKFFKLKWYEVYDLIEFVLHEIPERKSRSYSGNVKSDYKDFGLKIIKIFESEGVPYKFIEGKITPISSKQESKEVEKALEGHKFSEVKSHLQNALKLFSKRPNPDYLNSIKESISAVEALAREVLGDESSTLGQLVSKLDIHPALQEGLSKLYGWTSDESGIRHSKKKKKFSTDKEEARYMLVTCSALINYIISKQD